MRVLGEPLPLKHGYPLRALALGWTGANCVKWLSRIFVRDRPTEGFFMDSVSIITQPQPADILAVGIIAILGAAYAGEAEVERVEVSTDGGATWRPSDFIGPHEPYAWRQWQLLWEARERGSYMIMARAVDGDDRRQPMQAEANVLGYGNNSVREHAVQVTII